MARAATDGSLQLFALAPVSRGEAGVRGTAVEFHGAARMVYTRRTLTLALSPADRGEGTRGRSDGFDRVRIGQ
jgi:hypothetical protein